MKMPRFGTTRRQQEAADRFHEELEAHACGEAPDDVGVQVALALRPTTALNEARRTQMRDAMLAAFDYSCAAADERPVAALDATQVSTAEVLTSDGLVRLADVEKISEERAQVIAEAVLRQVSEIKGDVRGFRSDRRS